MTTYNLSRNTCTRVMRRLIVFFAFLPLVASAHVKWFVPTAVPPVSSYSLADWQVYFGVIVSAGLAALALFLERRLPWPSAHVSLRCTAFQPYIYSLFSVVMGSALIIFSILGYIFAPNIVAQGRVGGILLVAQGVIGIGFLLGVFVRFFAIALVGLYSAVSAYFGAYHALDTLDIIGISLFLAIVGRPMWTLARSSWAQSWWMPFRAYAVPLLRVFTGLNLIVLGFSEKLLRPDLGVAFLALHPWNFMEMAGFSGYTDYWFVFSAGIVEALFGFIFIAGFITRINTAVLSVFFITTLILLGPVELIAHLPYFAIVAVLLLSGSGERLTFRSSREMV